MTTVRRIALLLVVSVFGIALLAPLAARSAIELPVATPDQLLAHPGPAQTGLMRGGVLSARTTLVVAAAPAPSPETLVSAEAAEPRSVSMVAELVPIPTPPPPAPPPARRVVTSDGNSVWDRLAQCESSGNWAANTGNGYYGGLQFDLSTWRGYDGAEFAAYPHQATRAEQITVAERLRAARGYQPWPACRIKLGLP